MAKIGRRETAGRRNGENHAWPEPRVAESRLRALQSDGITEAQLRERFEIIDRGLDITDAAYEG